MSEELLLLSTNPDDTAGECERDFRVIDKFGVCVAIDHLLNETTLEKLTVETICKNANISRASFYRMFSDKYDALNWFMFRTLDLGNRLTGINYSWYGGNLTTISCGEKLVNLFRSPWQGHDYYGMRVQGINYRYRDILKVLGIRNIEVTPELEFQAHNYAYLESHMVRRWYNDDNRMPLKQLCEYMADCVPRQLFEALNDPIDPKEPVEHTLSSMLAAFVQLPVEDAPPLPQ